MTAELDVRFTLASLPMRPKVNLNRITDYQGTILGRSAGGSQTALAWVVAATTYSGGTSYFAGAPTGRPSGPLGMIAVGYPSPCQQILAFHGDWYRLSCHSRHTAAQAVTATQEATRMTLPPLFVTNVDKLDCSVAGISVPVPHRIEPHPHMPGNGVRDKVNRAVCSSCHQSGRMGTGWARPLVIRPEGGQIRRHIWIRPSCGEPPRPAPSRIGPAKSHTGTIRRWRGRCTPWDRHRCKRPRTRHGTLARRHQLAVVLRRRRTSLCPTCIPPTKPRPR